MYCGNCKNKKYCVEIKKGCSGCTSGVPNYLPKEVAKTIYYIINKACKDLDIDYDEYLMSVFIDLKNKSFD